MTKINGKSPGWIKDSLENNIGCCVDCNHCCPTRDNPYGCSEREHQATIAVNALAYIRQLEEENKELKNKYEAAVEDLEYGPCCATCVYEDDPITSESPCRTCKDAYCYGNWQWRGLERR